MSSPLSQENINPESQPQSPQCPINAQASPTLTCPIELDTKSDTAVPESPSPEENPPHQPSLSPLQNFYHASVTQSRIQLFISSVLILTLVYFQVNFFVIAFVLWCSSFHISRTLKSKQQDFEFSFEKDKLKATLVSSFPFKNIRSVLWCIIHPLFLSHISEWSIRSQARWGKRWMDQYRLREFVANDLSGHLQTGDWFVSVLYRVYWENNPNKNPNWIDDAVFSGLKTPSKPSLQGLSRRYV